MIEKVWKTRDPYFHFMMSIISVIVIDAWKIYRWLIESGPNRSKIPKKRHHRDWRISILTFAECVALALLYWYKPNVTNTGYIYGDPRVVNKVELEERNRSDDSSIEAVPNLNGKVVEPDV